MSFQEDPRLIEAKAIPIAELVDRLGIAGLKPMAGELIGPCPLCGGRDRFGINLRSHLFQCRKCDLRGGDQIALVRGVLNMDFKAALQWLCGDRPAELDQAEIERRRRRAAKVEKQQRDDAERYRRKAIADARSIWSRGRNQPVAIAQAYLKTRGLDVGAWHIPAIRVLRDHAYVKKTGGALVTMYRGPCMIAAIQGSDGRLCAVHQTWLAQEAPHRKAVIEWDGDLQPSKLVRGSKKGAAIRLHTPQGADTLVMGEGIETTLTALVAQPFPNAAYWAGIDLGNMAGRMRKVQGKKFSGLPDMRDAEAFVPPPWVRRLIFIMDGDSKPDMTRAKLECGLRRAMARVPGLKGQIVPAGEGVDLNDVLMSGPPDDQDQT